MAQPIKPHVTGHRLSRQRKKLYCTKRAVVANSSKVEIQCLFSRLQNRREVQHNTINCADNGVLEIHLKTVFLTKQGVHISIFSWTKYWRAKWQKGRQCKWQSSSSLACLLWLHISALRKKWTPSLNFPCTYMFVKWYSDLMNKQR